MNVLTKRLLALGASAVIAATGGYLVGPFEGKENKAYKDIVGIPTICYGQTKGVKLGDYMTDAECEKDLAVDLEIYNQKMKKYVTIDLYPYEEIAYTSFIWNVGETAWKKSTLLKKLNSGDKEGACNELLRWNKAGGKVVKGLSNRREAERQICLGNLGSIPPEIFKTAVDEESPKVDTNTYTQGEKAAVAPSEPSQTDASQNSPTPDVKITFPECKFKFLGICWKK